jgi:hypothetical protein
MSCSAKGGRRREEEEEEEEERRAKRGGERGNPGAAEALSSCSCFLHSQQSPAENTHHRRAAQPRLLPA